jgi:hypothetical protein
MVSEKTLLICEHENRIYKMAYLTLSPKEDNRCFNFIGTNSSQNDSINLISSSTSLLSNQSSLLSSNDNLDFCSFYSGPSDSTILAFGESAESCGSIAFSGTESCGSIAFSGGSESCGSIASSSSCSSGSACSYSC